MKTLVTLDCLDEVVQTILLERWRSKINVLPTGEAGWYRRLDRSGRVGVVATAQGLIALKRVRAEVPWESQVKETLIRRQREDGSWGFVSTLNNQGVVDATAWVVL